MTKPHLESLAAEFERRAQTPTNMATSEEFLLAASALRQYAQPQSPMGRAFTQIAHDEGKPDLAVLWQAVIDNTKGSGFWLGELLLTTIEKETGFNGSALSRPDRKCE